jgi:hypothetical protein
MKLIRLFEKQKGNLSVDEIRKFLHEKCSPFLAHNKSLKSVMYRALVDPIMSNYEIQKTHETRKPRDSTIEYSKLCSEYLKNKFDHDYRTNNVLFGMRDDNAIRSYGPNVYLVIPIGDYKLCYSEKLSDTWINANVLYLMTKLTDNEQRAIIKKYITKKELIPTDTMAILRLMLMVAIQQPEFTSGETKGDVEYRERTQKSVFSTMKRTSSEEEYKSLVHNFKELEKHRFKEFIFDLFDIFNYSETMTFGDVKHANHEIMMRCEEYMLIDIDSETYENFCTVIEETK